MAGKPDISAAPGVQNVLVYVSNDNFAQAYAVGQPADNGANNNHQSADYNNHVDGTKLKEFPDTSGGYYLQNFYHQQQQNGDIVDRSRVREEPNYDGYVTVMGAEGPPHSVVRCDSVRSETAESSCSSLSSSTTDESMLLVQNQSDMVVYDNGVRQNSVVFTVGTAGVAPQQTVSVPHGWKRLLNHGSVIYISPSNTALNSPEQVKEYLLTAGTCKCGLECHFKYDNTFNFDPKVASKSWTFTPDTNTGDLTKLCNHKRKLMAMSPFDGKPPDPNNIMKIRKDGTTKKSKRKIGLPYPGGCVSVSPAYQRPDKLFYGKENQQNQPQIWSTNGRLPSGYQDNNYPQHMIRYQGQQQEQHNMIVENQMMVPQQQQQQQSQQQQANISHNPNPNIRIHQHHVLAPNGQVISVHPVNNSSNQQPQPANGQNVVPNQQQRLFLNNQPNEPSGPGRPNLQMVPIGMAPQQQQHDRMFSQQPQQYQQYDASKMRPAFMPGTQVMNGYRPQNIMISNSPQQQQWNHRMPMQAQQQMVPNQQQQQQLMPNQYDNRVPPLHQHPPAIWQEEIKRKKVKLSKQSSKNRQYHHNMMECQNMQHGNGSPCPNIDVRQLQNDNAGRQVIVNSMTASPSFMEDPSGYLAQQTALLNNTINRQTGVNGCPLVCNNEVPLPSNVMLSQMKPSRSNQKAQNQYNSQIMADSSEQHVNCQGCLANKLTQQRSSTPSNGDDPVTSSNYSDKHQGSPDSRPIQGGTVSTSNVSPITDGSRSDPSTPNPHTPTPPTVYNNNATPPSSCATSNYACCSLPKATTAYSSGVVTAMASGRTIGSNTITSVLAGRANTATVSINGTAGTAPIGDSMNVSKSPLEMVQSVVSSIQMPPQHSPNIVKHTSPTGLPPGHILVSSGGQLIMANTGGSQASVMPPPPPKLVTNQAGMPPISVSPMVTNVTAAVSQVIPAVAQQVLGQQTVLVNALPAPFVLQPGVTMTMDSVVGQNVQLPLVAGNMLQQPIQIDSGNDGRRGTLMSPETGQKKKGKKRKVAGQTVANMLQIAHQQNPGVVMSQPSFPQQIQMAHSPQGLMQALTIVPSKNGGQILMNGQASPMINSQQQINLLQPVNLINGTTGVVQNFPTIQQFIVPNLGGMVMNPDGTATILQDTSNLGMQLQLQNVNGQNVLTPVQSTGMFNGGQSILTASPAGMVIRTPPTSQGKIIQQQQHSPGQFLSPNGGQFVVNGQFGGQLSPLVATNVSPNFTTQQQIRGQQPAHQEFIQCNQMGQTLMVPCTPTPNISVSSSNQNTATFVQQNTTIVQQQTTMVANNQQQLQIQQQQHQNQQQQIQLQQQNQQHQQQHNQHHHQQPPRSLEQQSFVISSHNDKQQVQAVLVQRDTPPNYRQTVSTQTAVNQNAQTVTTFCQTSTLCAGSPPDTTTHSPMATGGQSPPTADTTTHSGSTDDGLSPAPSSCSAVCDSGIGMNNRPQSQCTMAMVHCISSSEPDSADLNTHLSENDWSRLKPEELVGNAQIHFTDSGKKSNANTPFAESSTMVHLIEEQKSGEETVVSSHNYDKMVHHHHHHHSHNNSHNHHNSVAQKRSKNGGNDALLVLEANNQTSLFDEDVVAECRRNDFVVGDLVWGPSKLCTSWPGKITEIHEDHDLVTVKWFGNEKLMTKLKASELQTLTEGLDAHHRARKKCRTSRKLSSHLEKAIQEAMSELDKEDEPKAKMKMQRNGKKATAGSRLRSGN